MATKAQIEANRKNALKGGRQKGFAAKQAEQARVKIAELLEKSLVPIAKVAVKRALKGDKYARDWLTDRAYGKSRQVFGLEGGEEGDPIELKSVKGMTDKQINDYLKTKLSGPRR